jgi:hypothetical protein
MNLQDNVKGGRHMTQLGQKCNQNFSQTFSQDTAAFRTETDGIGTKKFPKMPIMVCMRCCWIMARAST